MAADEVRSPAGQAPRHRSGTTAVRRRERSQEIIAATRALFDARGVRDAQIEDIARAVGINRAIIYRHFVGKEELFALTLVEYLHELATRIFEADDEHLTPPERLRRVSGAFLDYGVQYPAFVDCAQALLRRTGDELMDEVSEGALFALGRAIAGCLRQVVRVLEAGNDSGDFQVKDPDLLANVLYTQALGGLQLTRLRLSVREATPGHPEVSKVAVKDVKGYLTSAAVAMASGAGTRD